MPIEFDPKQRGEMVRQLDKILETHVGEIEAADSLLAAYSRKVAGPFSLYQIGELLLIPEYQVSQNPAIVLEQLRYHIQNVEAEEQKVVSMLQRDQRLAARDIGYLLCGDPNMPWEEIEIELQHRINEITSE